MTNGLRIAMCQVYAKWEISMGGGRKSIQVKRKEREKGDKENKEGERRK